MPKVLIIGGGVSGLCAGIYAKKSGLDAEIFESHSIVGGQCTAWKRKGFHIDNCVHWLTGTSKDKDIYKVWNEVGVLGDDKPVIRHESFLQVSDGKKTLHLWRDLNKLKDELLAVSPEDKKEILNFVSIIKKMQHIELPSDKPVEQMGFWANMRTLWKMLPAIRSAIKYFSFTLEQYAERFKSDLIKSLIYNYLPKRYNIISAFYMFAMFTSGNADLPLGGSMAITERMTQKFLSLGGKIFCRKKAVKVDIENGVAKRVRFEDGTVEQADFIICATDAHVAFDILGKEYMDDHFKSRYNDYTKFPVSSNVNLYFAADDTLKDIPQMEIFKCQPYVAGGITLDQIVTNTYYEQPDYAPQGKGLMQVLIVQDDNFDLWKNLYDNDRDAYKAEKLRIAEDVKQRLEIHYPQLKGKLELVESVTPVSFNRFCGSYKGSYMAFIQTTTGKKECHTGVIKGVNNVFLAGQWLQVPGGLPNALVVGKFAVQRLLKHNNKEERFCKAK